MSKRYFEIKEVQNPTSRSILQGKINAGRGQLLWVSVLSLLNIAFLIFKADIYMIYSAMIPYIVIDLGMFICGMYSPEYYEYYEHVDFLPQGLFAIFVIIALVLAGLLLLSYFLSQKRKGWMIFGLAYICVDLIANIYVYGLYSQTIIDTVFHIIMIVFLVRGVIAYHKIQKLPPEEKSIEEFTSEEAKPDLSNYELINSTPLRIADLSVKSRTLLEYTHNGHHILYRRVKKTNELVIDNYVYGEYIAWAEFSHALTANIDGHTYIVGFNSATAKSFVKIDNITMLEKMRLI